MQYVLYRLSLDCVTSMLQAPYLLIGECAVLHIHTCDSSVHGDKRSLPSTIRDKWCMRRDSA